MQIVATTFRRCTRFHPSDQLAGRQSASLIAGRSPTFICQDDPAGQDRNWNDGTGITMKLLAPLLGTSG